ncbi:SprT family zinc-dependent metalloprotease [Methanorbis furvi]|uniref:YgjP-like metallopeptidase domain-containing protein n=1 Tax=Methanorbis furvi TaxID=3028299 RepID=A0AAE4MDY6_9EURY|nr:hypothetical protein [Methanocorpusculaceae archaeon Ag1]
MRSEEVTGFGSVVWEGESIAYTVVYSSRRKSWAVEVKPDGCVIVRMPQHVPPEKVRKLVEEKAEWISTQVKKYRSRVEIVRNYMDGEILPFFGAEYPVVRKTGAVSKAEFLDDCFVITIPDSFDADAARDVSKDMVVLLFRRMGFSPLEEIIAHYAPLAGVEPPKLRIRLQERKWGCCTPKNGIIVNARVLLAPKIVAEYIVVHELAHLRYRHHQKSFWDEVERLMPNYREAEKILKTDGWRFVF